MYNLVVFRLILTIVKCSFHLIKKTIKNEIKTFYKTQLESRAEPKRTHFRKHNNQRSINSTYSVSSHESWDQVMNGEEEEEEADIICICAFIHYTKSRFHFSFHNFVHLVSSSSSWVVPPKLVRVFATIISKLSLLANIVIVNR